MIIASHNQGKVAEFEKMLSPYVKDLRSLADFPQLLEVEETGDSFEANARLKAETVACELDCICLADDSGLMVEALNGAPGVYSARYSGEPRSDQRNNQKLLRELANTGSQHRRAKFVTCIVVAAPNRESLVVHGEVEGQILEEEQGHTGFGYDPLFYYPPLGKTFAELSLAEKNRVSHRGRAMEALMTQLPQWLEVSNSQ